MSLEEHLSTFVDSFASSNYVSYSKWCAGREWAVCGKVMKAVMENGETLLTVAPLTEYDPTHECWYKTRFNRLHTVIAEDVIEYSVIPAAAVS